MAVLQQQRLLPKRTRKHRHQCRHQVSKLATLCRSQRSSTLQATLRQAALQCSIMRKALQRCRRRMGQACRRTAGTAI